RAASASRMPLLGAAAVGDASVVFTAVSRDSVADELGPFTWVEGRCDNEIVHSSPLLRKRCPKRGRNALPRAGFTLEKCLIFPGGASPAPISHAVAAEIPRNDEKCRQAPLRAGAASKTLQCSRER